MKFVSSLRDLLGPQRPIGGSRSCGGKVTPDTARLSSRLVLNLLLL